MLKIVSKQCQHFKEIEKFLRMLWAQIFFQISLKDMHISQFLVQNVVHCPKIEIEIYMATFNLYFLQHVYTKMKRKPLMI